MLATTLEGVEPTALLRFEPVMAVDFDAAPSAARLGFGGVPIFPNTHEGQAERLAYYEARKLNHLPDSLFDYRDVIRGRETPAERRSREGRATGRRR